MASTALGVSRSVGGRLRTIGALQWRPVGSRIPPSAAEERDGRRPSAADARGHIMLIWTDHTAVIIELIR